MRCANCGFPVQEDVEVPPTECPSCGNNLLKPGSAIRDEDYGTPGLRPLPPPIEDHPLGVPRELPVPQLTVKEALNEAWFIYGRNLASFTIFWTVPAKVIIVVNLILILLTSRDPATAGGEGLALLMYLIMVAFFSGGIIGMAAEAMRRGRTTWRTGYRIVRQRWRTLWGTMIVLLMIFGFGFVLCIVPGIIFCAWWAFALVAAVVQGTDLRTSMRRSKEFSKSHSAITLVLALLGLTLLIQLVGILLNAVFLFILPPLFSALISSTMAGITTWFTIPYVFTALTYYYVRKNRL